jgi:hypothetical protein
MTESHSRGALERATNPGQPDAARCSGLSCLSGSCRRSDHLTSVRATEIDSHPPVWIPRQLSLDSYKILFGMPTPEGAFGLGGEIPVATYARN